MWFSTPRTPRIAALLIAATLVAADLPSAVPEYLTALIHVEERREFGSVEPVFHQGLRAAESLLIPSRPGGAAPIELLDDETFEQLRVEMKGFEVSRAERLIVAPVPDFFVELADREEDLPGIAFFKLLGATQADPGRRRYHEPVTDSSVCTRYGSLILVRLFGKWRMFRTSHPQAYVRDATQIFEEIERELLEGTCACDGEQSVLRELRAFLGTYPEHPLVPRVLERIRELEEGESPFRFSCRPG